MPTRAPAFAFAGLLCLLAASPAPSQTRAVHVDVRFEISGEAQLRAWPQSGELSISPVLPQVLRCQGESQVMSGHLNGLDCANALRRNGLSLEADLDLAPIAAKLDPAEAIELTLAFPSAGFDALSTPMQVESDGVTEVRTLRFDAGSPPPPIHLQFGYRPDQLVPLYLPLFALALSIAMLALLLSRSGLANLNLSVFLLGTVFWMGMAARLQASVPLKILFFGTVWAHVAVMLLDFVPPLAAVALGAALGSPKRTGQEPIRRFAEVFCGYGIFLLPVLCAVGALPFLTVDRWTSAIGWLLALPAVAVACLFGLRASVGGRPRQVTEGPLKDRVSQLAARVGQRPVRVFLTSPSRAQNANAFAFPGRSIFFTTALVESLSAREVDAVAAHELSHFRHRSRRPWTALAIAMVLFETPVRDQIVFSTPLFLIALLTPPIFYVVALREARKREFEADAGAAALVGDPRPMIAALAKICRINRGTLALHPVVEWLASHPSTLRRIQSLAARAGLSGAEVEVLLASGIAGEPYTVPSPDAAPIFSVLWQRRAGALYGWTGLVAASFSGLLAAWLLDRMALAGPMPAILGVVLGIALGCLLAKCLPSAVIAASYQRLRRKLEAKLGTTGQMMGLAVDSVPRVYGGFRFSDAGLFRIENGQLRYRSERTAIRLNPSDVVEIGTAAASPSSWLGRQPIVRFRHPESGGVYAFLLHPVEFWPAHKRLLRSLEEWKASPDSTGSTAIEGFQAIEGRRFRNPTMAGTARAFLVSGGITLAAASVLCQLLPAPWPFAVYAVAVSACAHVGLYLPALLYRPSAAILDTPHRRCLE